MPRLIAVQLAVLVMASLTACGLFHRAPEQLTVPADSVMTCREGTPGVTVEWIDAADETDSATNASWCRTLGPWIVDDRGLPSEFTATDSLAIITWNMLIGGGDLVPFIEDFRSGIHTDGPAPEHFVVLLQEVYRADADLPKEFPEGIWIPKRKLYDPPSGDRIDIVEAARRLGMWLYYVPSMRNGGPEDIPLQEDRGNAILSTVALGELAAIVLPFERYRRVALAATAKGTSADGRQWRLRICNAHLDNWARFPRFLQSAGAGRLRQARALLPWLREVPCVLGGDFNTWAPESLEISIPFIRETFRQPDVLGQKPTVAVPILPDRRVDYLFFNLPDGLDARYNRIENRYGSDHYPLLGWVRLVPGD